MKNIVRVAGVAIALVAAAGSTSVLVVNDREQNKLASRAQKNKIGNGDTERGKYVASMGGCIACHTNIAIDGKPLAGGVPIATPFGTFYSPNITSDKAAGIGDWSTETFIKVMSLGLSPEDEHYYPAFPYTSYSAMTSRDLVDLKAWLDTVEPVSTRAPEHELIWPASIRSTLVLWKALFFDPLRYTEFTDRGDYLVNGPAHCVECHSPRNLLGGLSSHALTGNKRGPEGEAVPGITADDLGEWVLEDLELFLEVGITPSGDFTGGHMADVVEYSTAQLHPEDRTAIALYLLSDDNRP